LTFSRLANKRFFLAIVGVVVVVVIAMLVARRPVTNYPDSDRPLFSGQYSDGPPDGNSVIKVITWNIAFAKEVEQAIEEFQENQALQGAGIILLQEMDEAGTEAIASALNYDYVYYPASIHSRHDRNFGNAVLSKWPILDSEKIILPHQNPTNEQIRIAVRALLSIDGREVPVYSVHTETFWLGSQGRNDQFAYLAEQYGPDNEFVIAGGDFNTVTPASLASLDDRFRQVGMERVSEGAGETKLIGAVGFTLDHIYARGLNPIASGVVNEAEASDHKPVWVDLSLAEADSS
jgi:endonuclease/exonuclease/phosphatase family metal-dependent hydrolase